MEFARDRTVGMGGQREKGLRFTDLLMKWTDVRKSIGMVFCTHIPQDLCTDLKSHSPCAGCRNSILSEPCSVCGTVGLISTVISTVLISRTTVPGTRLVSDLSATTRKVETLVSKLLYNVYRCRAVQARISPTYFQHYRNSMGGCRIMPHTWR